MKFVKVKNTKLNIEYDWLADISSLEDLMEIEKAFSTKNASNIWEYLNSKDYYYALNQHFENVDRSKFGNDHCSPVNKIVPLLSALTVQAVESKVSPILFFSNVMDKIVASKAESLGKYGRIFINKNGGYFAYTNYCEILEVKEWHIFPQYEKKDIKVSKWPEGTHWYITCNGSVVEVDGIPKWINEKDAWDAAERWIKKEK